MYFVNFLKPFTPKRCKENKETKLPAKEAI